MTRKEIEKILRDGGKFIIQASLNGSFPEWKRSYFMIEDGFFYTGKHSEPKAVEISAKTAINHIYEDRDRIESIYT